MVNNLLSLLLMFLSKANDAFWSLKGIDVKYKADVCDIKWRVYKTCSNEVRYKEYCVENGQDMFTSEFYNQNIKETILLGLPFYCNFSNFNVKPMVKALTSRCEFNLIALDNTIHTNAESFLDYPVTMYHVYKDSKRYAKSLNKALKLELFSAKHVTAVGFSLGAQNIGHVCRNLDEKCGHILAIDAAGPLFAPKEIPLIKTHFPHMQLVSKSDACDVVFLECNRWLLGTGFRTAHKNILVNNGIIQPACIPGDLLCYHMFCNKLAINAILNPGDCKAEISPSIFDIISIKFTERDEFILQLPLKEGIGRCDNEDSKIYYLTTSVFGPRC